MKDPRERFSGTAELYRKFRPSYPPALIDWVLEVSGAKPGDRACDLGCGTGISTRLFAERGLDFVGVDPNEDMLALAREDGGATYVRGEATVTGLAPASFALLTAAQAFHWFPIEETLDEIARVLRPGGVAAAFWNVRAESPFLARYEALLREHSGDYEKVHGFEQTLDAVLASPKVKDVARTELANAQTLDKEGLFGRAWSSSYVLHGVSDRAAFDAALGRLFDEHASAGVVTFHYRVVAGAFRLG